MDYYPLVFYSRGARSSGQIMASLEERLKQQAMKLGFDKVGIARAEEVDSFDRYLAWLEQGHAGEMDYLHRRADARRHPASILSEVRSVVMVALNYNPAPQTRVRGSPGLVARYARSGNDYHDILWSRLDELLVWTQEQIPTCRGRSVVDTAPLLERDFARRAGLGWIGKNTMLLDKELGSYFFLGALLLDIAIVPDPPHVASHCGTCTACLDTCPTGAFPQPGVLDARKCISYLTIELKGAIPEEQRQGIGNWLFGCDVCQEVCPWNHDAPTTNDPAFAPHPDLDPADPIALLALSEDDFRQRFRHSALWRAKRRGILRNAMIVLGNTGDASAFPTLERYLDDSESILRESARWAIREISERLYNSELPRL
jgi:epoxyqueuosine reductase